MHQPAGKSSAKKCFGPRRLPPHSLGWLSCGGAAAALEPKKNLLPSLVLLALALALPRRPGYSRREDARKQLIAGSPSTLWTLVSAKKKQPKDRVFRLTRHSADNSHMQPATNQPPCQPSARQFPNAPETGVTRCSVWCSRAAGGRSCVLFFYPERESGA